MAEYNYIIGGTYQITPSVNEKDNAERHNPADDTFAAVAAAMVQKRSVFNCMEVLHATAGVCIMAIGGLYDGASYTNTVERFNTATETWTACLAAPAAKGNSFMPGPSIGGKGWLMGYGGEATSYRYDTDTGVFSSRSNMPWTGTNWSTFMSNYNLGNNTRFVMIPGTLNGSTSSWIYRFECLVDCWYAVGLTISSNNTQLKVQFRSNVVMDDRGCGFLCGGYGAGTTNRGDVNRYSDLFANKTAMAKMPEVLGQAYSGMNKIAGVDNFGDTGYAFGGLTFSPTTIKNWQKKYNIAANSWSTPAATLTTGRYRGGYGTNFINDWSDWWVDNGVPESPIWGTYPYQWAELDGAFTDVGTITGTAGTGSNLIPRNNLSGAYGLSKSGVWCKDLNAGFIFLAYFSDTYPPCYLCKTTDGKEYTYLQDINDALGPVELPILRIIGTTAYVYYVKHGIGGYTASIDLANNIVLYKDRLVGTTYYNQDGMLSFEVDATNTNRMVLIVGKSCYYRHSLDGGVTWTAIRRCYGSAPNSSDYPITGYERKFRSTGSILLYNLETSRIECLQMDLNNLPNCCVYCYYDFDSNQFVFIDNSADTGLMTDPLAIDATVDKDNGYIYALLTNNTINNNLLAVKMSPDASFVSTNSGGFYHPYYSSSSGRGSGNLIWQCHKTGNIIISYAVFDRDPNDLDYPYPAAYWYIKNSDPDVEKLQFLWFSTLFNFWHTPDVGGSKYSYDRYTFYHFDTNDYVASRTVGIDAIVFFNFIDKATRKPVSGKSILLKNLDGDTVSTLSEHIVYKGLYFGTIEKTMDISKVDIYVDSVKVDNVSPIVAVPSEYWPEYKSQH